MLSLSTQPGRLAVRSRTVPTWLVALLAALHVPIFVLLFVLALRVTWVTAHHGPQLIAALVGIPIAMLVGLYLFALPTRCTADRADGTVTVAWIRTRVHRLDAFRAVRAQTGADQAEARIREAIARTGRKPWFLGRPVDPRAAAARRVVMERADGSVLPVTAWLVGREDPAPIVEALRTFLAS